MTSRVLQIIMYRKSINDKKMPTNIKVKLQNKHLIWNVLFRINIKTFRCYALKMDDIKGMFLIKLTWCCVKEELEKSGNWKLGPSNAFTGRRLRNSFIQSLSYENSSVASWLCNKTTQSSFVVLNNVKYLFQRI